MRANRPAPSGRTYPSSSKRATKLRALAGAWLRENRARLGGFAELRFDVVGLRLDAQGRVTHREHLRAAF